MLRNAPWICDLEIEFEAVAFRPSACYRSMRRDFPTAQIIWRIGAIWAGVLAISMRWAIIGGMTTRPTDGLPTK